MPTNMRITAFVLLIRDLPIPQHNITNSPKVICHVLRKTLLMVRRVGSANGVVKRLS
jgi:hypothetical protein